MTITSRQRRESVDGDAHHWLEAHGDALFSYAVARVADRQTAEDMVQDTFLSAIRAADSFRGESDVRTWLTAILRRKIADHYRALSRQPLSVLVRSCDEIEQCAEPQVGNRRCSSSAMADALESEEFWSTLDNCLAKLPKTLAGTFVMRVMDGLEVSELCQLLGVTSSNLGVRLHRARRGLRDCLMRNWF